MSVLFQTSNCCLIDHGDYIRKILCDVSISQNETAGFILNRNLFSIANNQKDASRKRSHGLDKIQEETAMVKYMFDEFREQIPESVKLALQKYINADTGSVRDLSKKLFESTVFSHEGISGGNNSYNPLKCKVQNEDFLIPPNSRFLCGCVKEQCVKLEASKYDIVVADPPWWNKYIRRLKNANDKLSYKMMYNEDIASIPVRDLLSSNCIVAVWCTNAPSNISAVKDLIFPAWGVEYITTWHWLKVTAQLDPICAFGAGCKKQPYERLILGKVGDVAEIPEKRLIVSVPSALHSHKPPLLDLLSPFVKAEKPQALELFARYLLPNTTSVGFEPLKWQHISLYEKVTINEIKI